MLSLSNDDIKDTTPKDENVYELRMNEVNMSLAYLNYEEFMAWISKNECDSYD